MNAGPLAGRRVLVTRPLEQAEGLAALIRQAGGEPILFPAIEIAEPADLAGFHAIANRLEQFDLAIFISPTAVHRAIGLLQGRRWPGRLGVAAIGGGRHDIVVHRHQGGCVLRDIARVGEHDRHRFADI